MECYRKLALHAVGEQPAAAILCTVVQYRGLCCHPVIYRLVTPCKAVDSAPALRRFPVKVVKPAGNKRVIKFYRRQIIGLRPGPSSLN